MNYGIIKTHDVADGEGVRVTLFVSGCRHHCKGCFQPETWDFNYGKEYTNDTQNYIIEKLSPSHIRGLTLLGGEPFEKENQRVIISLLREVKATYPDKDIWAYSGYTLDVDLLPSDGKAHCEVTEEILSYIDVLVDGEYVDELRNLSLSFRGSSNQRVIDVQKSINNKEIVWHKVVR